MGETGSFGHGSGAGGELDVYYVVVGETLGGERVVLAGVDGFVDGWVGGCAEPLGGLEPAGGVVDYNDVGERGDEFRREFAAFEVGQDVSK